MANNMDDFNTCVALVFQRLYHEFPKETEIVLDDFIEPSNEEQGDNYFATIRFLQREGLLRYHELNFGIFTGVVLTAKGLKILRTVPNTEHTLVELIYQALETKNKEHIGHLIQKLINLSS